MVHRRKPESPRKVFRLPPGLDSQWRELVVTPDGGPEAELLRALVRERVRDAQKKK